MRILDYNTMYLRGQQRAESFLNGRPIEGFHIIKHFRKVFVNGGIDMRVRHRTEFEHRFVAVRFAKLKIIIYSKLYIINYNCKLSGLVYKCIYVCNIHPRDRSDSRNS